MTELQSLIREAFIDPIRSVLIVDDQYPTWEEILNDQLPKEASNPELTTRSVKKNWRDDPTGTLRVINQFRKQKPALIIDIHDASDAMDYPVSEEGDSSVIEKSSPQRTADHLHQSDLLILDYNLEGESSGLEGSLARNILKSVLCNRHFNLVIIHTQETNLKDVFHNCLLSLSSSLHYSFDRQKNMVDKVRSRLDELYDDEIFNPRDISDYFSLDAYMKLRHPSTTCSAELKQYMRGEGSLSRLHEWAETLGLRNGEKMGFAYWAIEQFEVARKSFFSDEPSEGLNWTQENERLWLRTGRGFVTFVKKDHQDLLSELQLSLEAWQPSPSRLLSAKVRHEISCNGVEAEDRTLSKSHVFAYFYDLIRNGGTEEKRATLIRDHLNRQTETLTSQIQPAVVKFGESIFDADSKAGGTFASHYGVDLSNDEDRRSAATHFNSYVSTLPLIDGDDQLDCGHIFQMKSEWWVCATPACDMVPGQNTIAFSGNSTELRPFTVLKLNEVAGSSLTVAQINSGLYCFAENENGTITCLGLGSQEGNDIDLAGSEKVTWRTFVAKNSGRFTNGEIEIIRPKLKAGGIELPSDTANIKAKLRYEYALNYIRKVGASVTRIGLGYHASSFSKQN